MKINGNIKEKDQV